MEKGNRSSSGSGDFDGELGVEGEGVLEYLVGLFGKYSERDLGEGVGL